jgi:hypothetical protein
MTERCVPELNASTSETQVASFFGLPRIHLKLFSINFADMDISNETPINIIKHEQTLVEEVGDENSDTGS